MIKVIFEEAFCRVYDHDPAAEEGRMEAIARAIHNQIHIKRVNIKGFFLAFFAPLR